MDTLGIIKNKYPVSPMNNMDSNKKSFLIHYINNESDGNINRKREDNFQEPRLEKLDHRQNQKTLYAAPNI